MCDAASKATREGAAAGAANHRGRTKPSCKREGRTAGHERVRAGPVQAHAAAIPVAVLASPTCCNRRSS